MGNEGVAARRIIYLLMMMVMVKKEKLRTKSVMFEYSVRSF